MSDLTEKRSFNYPKISKTSGQTLCLIILISLVTSLIGSSRSLGEEIVTIRFADPFPTKTCSLSVKVDSSCKVRYCTSGDVLQLAKPEQGEGFFIFLETDLEYKNKIVEVMSDTIIPLERNKPLIKRYRIIINPAAVIVPSNVREGKVFFSSCKAETICVVDNEGKIASFSFTTGDSSYFTNEGILFWIELSGCLPRGVRGAVSHRINDTIYVDLDTISFERIPNVLIGSNPTGAWVIIKDKQIGKTPREVELMGCAVQNVTLKKEGYQDTTFSVSPGDSILVDLKEVKKMCDVTVTSKINGIDDNVTVFINELGPWVTRFTKKLEYGRYVFKFTKPGRKDSILTVTIDRADTVINVVLIPLLFGELEIISKPPGAKIFLDGQPTNESTPCLLKDLAAGYHTIKISKCLYKAYHGREKLEPGVKSRLDVKLTKESVILLSPQNSTYERGDDVCFEWSAITCHNDRVSFELEASADSFFTTDKRVFWMSESDTCIKASSFEDGQNYWRITAHSREDSICSSMVFTFTVLPMKRTKILAANRVEAKYSYKFCEKGRFQGVRPKLPFESSLEVSVPMVAGIELKRYVNFNAGVDVSIVSPVGKISDFGFQFTPNLALSVLGKGPYVNPAILIGLSLGFVEIGVREKAYSFGEFKMGGVLGIAEDEVSKILFSMLWSRVPYKTDQEIVETFEGNGWEIGCNVVIPEEVIPEFTLPFVGTVDLRRWPIEYSYSKIKNGDGVEIKEHTFGIGYLLD